MGKQCPDFVREETLADIFRNAAKEFKQNIALIFGSRQITYQALDRWSDEMANFLQAQGIGRGDSVGLWYPRSLELHIAVLGIVKSGAAYVPLDKDMPADRVVTVLEEVNAKAYFSTEALELNCKRLQVIDEPKGNGQISVPTGPTPENWAYVLYTSGSTGKPKGIPISHRQISHFVRAEQSVIEIKSTDRVYQGISVSFDMWCEETWISYFAGATMWVADSATAKSIDELDEVLRENKITVLHTVPSLLGVMNEDVPLLRIVNAGGEACSPLVVSRWAIPSRKFYNRIIIQCFRYDAIHSGINGT